ncbi:hypothetical protein SAMD00019534_072020, partial [Acytostelium subglobosum LB1]|uniref:hypothetical protein n=1 Tax=Acytostelium subglobosum LB1 TaxID=1410327 RepID=UPI0006448663
SNKERNIMISSFSGPTPTERFQRNVLADYSDSDPDFEVDLITSYKDSVNEHLPQLSESLRSNDEKASILHSHDIKGSSSYMGAEAVRFLSGKIEAYCKEGKLDEAANFMEELETEVSELFKLLDKHMASFKEDGSQATSPPPLTATSVPPGATAVSASQSTSSTSLTTAATTKNNSTADDRSSKTTEPSSKPSSEIRPTSATSASSSASSSSSSLLASESNNSKQNSSNSSNNNVSDKPNSQTATEKVSGNNSMGNHSNSTNSHNTSNSGISNNSSKSDKELDQNSRTATTAPSSGLRTYGNSAASS